MPSKWAANVLSAAFVRTVKDLSKYTDGYGLILKVDPSGAKRWVQRIVLWGKRTEIGLSVSLVTLAEALETALENRKLARAGGHPLQAKWSAQALLPIEDTAR